MRRILFLSVLALLLQGRTSAQPPEEVKARAAAVSADSLALPSKIGAVRVSWILPTEVVRAAIKDQWVKRSRSDRSDSATTPRPSDTVSIHALPKTIRPAAPEYPEIAKSRGLEARVWVAALLDVDGTVLGARIAKGSGHPYEIGFEKSALIAAMQNLYQPAQQDSEAVKIWVTYPVDFVLRRKR